MTNQFFLLRLLGPRPTFPLDMTVEERTAMQQHIGYWQGLIQAGTAFVVGPVADPKGVWGLAVVRAVDAAAVDALQAADPVILSGLGFRYEVLQMLNAIVKE